MCFLWLLAPKGLLHRTHALGVGDTIEPEVRPQRAPQKQRTPEVEEILVKEGDVGAGTRVAKVDPRLLPEWP